MPTRELVRRASELLRVEEERQRAWLHDTVLQVLEYVGTAGYGTCHSVDELAAVAANAAENLRASFDDHTPRIHAASLREELVRAVVDARALGDVPIRLELGSVTAPSTRYPVDELASSMREALTNARKHSRASAIDVRCRIKDDNVEVLITDDGVGFDTLAVAPGIGMRESMYGRMARCGGYVGISSTPGVGTAVRLIAPPLAPALETVA